MAAYLVLNNQRTVEDDIDRALNRLNRVFHNAIDVAEALQYTMKKAPDRSEELKGHIEHFHDSEVGRVVSRLTELTESCEGKRSSDLESMSNYFEAIVSEKFLAALIEESFDDEKEAREDIGSYVGQLLALRLERFGEKRQIDIGRGRRAARGVEENSAVDVASPSLARRERPRSRHVRF